MADDKSKMADKAGDRVADRVTDKVTDKASEIAKNIWLAGVGAYGRAVDEAQGRLEKAGVEPPKLFRELVKAGAALEDEARDAIEAGHAARSSVEDRINRVRENFNLQRPVRGEDLLALHTKIDRLAASLDALVDVLGAGAAQPANRPTTAKKPRKLRATASARKPSKKAPSPKKSAPKKSAVKKPAVKKPAAKRPAAKTAAKTRMKSAATPAAKTKAKAPARKKSSGR
jgi:hypothetical protein